MSRWMFDEVIEDIENIGDLGVSESFNIKFKEYRLELLGDELCIVGRTKVLEQGYVAFTKPDMFLDLINLVQGQPPAVWSRDVLNELIPSSEIIKWCKKYGLLIEDDYVREFDINGREGHAGFRLHKARRNIAMLYEMFLLWKGLIEEDLDAVRKHLSIAAIPEYQDNNEQIAAVKKYLPYSLGSTTHVMVDFSPGQPRLKYIFNSLFDVCRHQFLLLIVRGGIKMKYLKSCQSCLKWFATNDGKKKYCPNIDCNPGKFYDVNKRKPRIKEV